MISYRFVVSAFYVFLLLATSPTFSQGQQINGQRIQHSGVPTPKSVLGFEPGDDRTIADWAQITNYFNKLDQASDRVLVKVLGQSTLKRPLIVAFISARENILALEKYKLIQQQLADPRKITSSVLRDRLIASGKVVVAISCSIHSTEIVASQMSMKLAYNLATAEDAETRNILQNTIVLLIPSPNPDGIDIVANWYRKSMGTPYEGRELPELYHHYAGHDDNRDWFMLNLKETQQITRLFWHDWFPEIVYDIHQQGATGSRLFIPPFFDPPNPHIDPLLLRQVGLIGHKVAADLQSAGVKGVLTNAQFDTWWHGGFRTAPYFHNSIGILSEAASAQLMTPITVTPEQLARSSTRGLRSAAEATTNFPDPWPGGTWHPRDIMGMELIAARAILSLAANYRDSYLRNFYALGRRNVEEPIAENQPIAYLIPAGLSRDEPVAKLIGSLLEQGVEVYRLDCELHVDYGAQVLQRTNPVSDKLGTYKMIIANRAMQEVPAGSYMVFLSQPQRQNIRALFEPQIYPNRLLPSGQAERPYDVAGWTMPLQLGVEVAAVLGIREKSSDQKLTLLKNENEVRADLALPLRHSDASPIKNPIARPVRTAMYKSSTGNTDEGWTRYVFDTFNVPYTSLKNEAIRTGNLSSSFDVIVIPSQRSREIIDGNSNSRLPREYTAGIGSSGVTNLKDFVTAGGTIICFDASCDLPIKQFNLPLKNVLEGLGSSDFYCPGSIVSLEVDNRNPIAATLPRKVPGYFISSSAFATTDENVRVIARYATEQVLLSGWLLGEDKLRGQIAIAEVPFGKGRVVLFAFRPQHRGQTWATIPFIWNAIATSAK